MKTARLKIPSKLILLSSFLIIFGAIGCSPNAENTSEESAAVEEKKSEEFPEYGVGPITNVELAAVIEKELATKGKELFDANCTACHKIGERYVGPDLAEVTERRNPAWVMNMIMNPVEMTQKDPIAKQLLGEYLTQMADQNINEEQARAILEYLREVKQENQ